LRRRIAAVTADPICEELKVRGSTRRARSASKAFDLNKGVGKMKYAFLALGVLVSATALIPSEAGAVVWFAARAELPLLT
jgi:hypothetical protein